MRPNKIYKPIHFSENYFSLYSAVQSLKHHVHSNCFFFNIFAQLSKKEKPENKLLFEIKINLQYDKYFLLHPFMFQCVASLYRNPYE